MMTSELGQELETHTVQGIALLVVLCGARSVKEASKSEAGKVGEGSRWVIWKEKRIGGEGNKQAFKSTQ